MPQDDWWLKRMMSMILRVRNFIASNARRACRYSRNAAHVMNGLSICSSECERSSAISSPKSKHFSNTKPLHPYIMGNVGMSQPAFWPIDLKSTISVRIRTPSYRNSFFFSPTYYAGYHCYCSTFNFQLSTVVHFAFCIAHRARLLYHNRQSITTNFWPRLSLFLYLPHRYNDESQYRYLFLSLLFFATKCSFFLLISKKMCIFAAKWY